MDHESTRRRRPQTATLPTGAPPSETTRKRERRRRRRRKESPFWILFLQVGATLLILSFTTVSAYRWIWPVQEEGEYVMEEVTVSEDTSSDEQAYRNHDPHKEKEPVPETAPPIPTFELSSASNWDAFAMAAADTSTNPSFWKASAGLRREFADTYGGENAARMLIDQGLTTFASEAVPEDLVATACRIHTAKTENRPFRMAFGGYSVTVGRGNLFEQSFPFQMQKKFKTVFLLAGLEDLQVHNAAIGGCPAFPYGWCMKNFWGENPDVVSWDFSMNEAGGVPEGLEAYIRHLLATYPRPPKLLVKDTFMASQRRGILASYSSFLRDPVVIHTDPAVKHFLDRKEEYRPIGFQEWRKFGAPVGAPGQAAHHPGVKEHEMIGWILGMHFLTALEYMVSKGDSLQCPGGTDVISSTNVPLPPPFTGRTGNGTHIAYDQTLFGTEISSATSNQGFIMNPTHCRTTFQPIVSGDLSEVVVSGTTAEDIDILLPKSQMYYNQGWTLDLSEGEKAAKRKLSLYENSLGFIDSKEAYYGIFESKKMKLLLPYEHNSRTTPKLGENATNWFDSIVLCQVNEKRDSHACDFGADVGVVVGGANATNIHIMKDAGTLYLGKPVCIHLDIPPDSILTSHNQLDGGHSNADQIGLLVEIFVKNPKIVHIEQACSVSHVIWQEKVLP